MSAYGFEYNGYAYRTNADATIVEGRDGSTWNRTHSLGVMTAAQTFLTDLKALALLDPGGEGCLDCTVHGSACASCQAEAEAADAFGTDERYVEHHDDDCPEGCQSDACLHYEMNPPADRRECPECGADVIGNDPHGYGCPSADPEDFRG